MAFPTSTPSYQGFTSSDTLKTDNHAAQHNSEQADITALANKVGTGASTPTSGVVLRGNGVGSSVWGQAILTSDVSGVLPQANGGTGQTGATGTGVPVYQTAPTITTPTIASFINAVHNHESNTGGGQLNAANALSAGSVSFANLLATIFSSQVTSAANAGTWGGTNSYINLGGIKLCWGISAAGGSTLGSGTAADKIVTLPVGFFSSLQTVIVSTPSSGGSFTNWMVPTSRNNTTTQLDILLTNAGSGTSSTDYQVSWLVIGT